MYSRRNFLGMAGLAGLALNSPLALANNKPKGTKTLKMRNLHTNEKVSCTYWIEGEYQLEALQEVHQCLRDHRTGDVSQIDHLLLDHVYNLADRMEYTGEIHIISGYRSPKTNAMLNKTSSGVAKKSLHMQGRAIDLRLPGMPLSQVRKAALAEHKGGVGYYPKSNFLHLDTGRTRQWG
ncbi:YcbK family protein [Pseudomaricurvus sp.]|uniref:YcbK family protein n=1 Tax=Pseudomaricurvus sp. TaxID=2004510 RepID=UPI003F6AD7DC